MTFSVPEYKVYGGAENLAQTMHNLLPVRGAKARDALRWSTYMQEALDQLGDAEVYVGQHNWPIWGQARIREFITKHRDVYKYTHDQTVRLANAGHTPREIADLIKLPKSLAELPQHTRLLRRPAPQREGGVPALPGRLRRQPGQPEPAAACRSRPSATWSSSAAPTRPWRPRRPPTTRATSAGRPSC
jgi:hypothetical protein